MSNKKEKIYIVDAVRSPIGKLYGALSNWRADDLMVALLDSLRLRTGCALEDVVEHIWVGCSNQAGTDNRNLARRIVMLGQLGVACNGTTLNSLCASGMDAVLSGARALSLGEADVVLAGGVETSSLAPIVRDRNTGVEYDSTIGWRFVNPKMATYFAPNEMSVLAEQHALRAKVSRAAQDEIARQSRYDYEQALNAGYWNNEIEAVFNKKGQLQSKDEQHRVLSTDLLSKLPPIVRGGVSITSGNAARIGDGASLLLLATERGLDRLRLDSNIVLSDWATAACNPDDMCLSAAVAARRLLDRSSRRIDSFDWFEIGESFALQRILCADLLGCDFDRVNPWGGALAMGNPTAMGSARQIVTLFNAIKHVGHVSCGLAAASAGLGVGSALVLESIN